MSVRRSAAAAQFRYDFSTSALVTRASKNASPARAWIVVPGVNEPPAERRIDRIRAADFRRIAPWAGLALSRSKSTTAGCATPNSVK
ncbi:hypothetical protein D3C85_1681490 [compost metagenome]